MNKQSFRKRLIVLNVLVWLLVLGGFIVNRQQEKKFVENHHQLVEEFNSYGSYEAYEKRITFLKTKMTPALVDQVCPVVPLGFSNEFQPPKLTAFKTEKLRESATGERILRTTFLLQLNGAHPFEQQTESVYYLVDGQWRMKSYRLIF